MRRLICVSELDQELYRGVEELRGLTKANFANHQFYLFETRRGIDQHVLLATTIGDYILQVMVGSHDEKTVKRLETSVEHLTFFPAADLHEVREDRQHRLRRTVGLIAPAGAAGSESAGHANRSRQTQWRLL